jgi:broad specificity phosphatase PhoE
MEIILIRHGKPKSADNPIINICEYAHWIRRYNASDVAKDSRPKSINANYQSIYTLSSDLKRAIHSANIYVGKQPETIDKIYREMEIPRYHLPYKLKAWHWVYFSRLLWVLGVKGSFESFKQAKKRAEKATDKLIKTSEVEGKVILFGHGFMNRYIRKSLIKKGWLLNHKSNAYWGITRLERS